LLVAVAEVPLSILVSEFVCLPLVVAVVAKYVRNQLMLYQLVRL
jgi:hypothetical protein